MNIGDKFTAYRPDGSEWDAVRVVGLDQANKAIVIVPDDGSFAAPESVEAASFHSFYGLKLAAEVATPETWESGLS